MSQIIARIFLGALACADAKKHELMHRSDWDKESSGMHVMVDTYASW